MTTVLVWLAALTASSAAPQAQGGLETFTLARPGGAPRVEWSAARDLEGNPVLEGRFARWHGNGEQALDGWLEAGLRRRRWTHRHPDGEVAERGLRVDDRRENTWTTYDRFERVLSEGEWQGGARSGPWRFADAEARPDPAASGEYGWSSDAGGSGAWLDGERHGRWTRRWPNGRLQLEGEYERGRRVGEWRFWHPDGTFDPAFLSGTYEAGRKVADAEVWRPETEDWTPPAVRPPLHAPDTFLAMRAFPVDARPEDLLERSPELVEGDLRGVTRQDVPRLVATLLRLDLADERQRALGATLVDALRGGFGGRTWSWKVPDSPHARAHDALQRMRMASLWLLVGDEPRYWRLEVPAPPTLALGDPLLAAIAPEGQWTRLLSDPPLLLNPPLYAPSAERTTPRARVRHNELEAALEDALAWLVQHQDEDGGWDSDDFAARCADARTPCDGAGDGWHDVGVTGLCVLALMRAGSSPLEGPHADAVRAGLQRLVAQQDPESGLVGDLSAPPTGTGATPGSAPVLRPLAPPRECGDCGGSGWRHLGGTSSRCVKCSGTGRVAGPPPRPPLREPSWEAGSAPAATGSSGIHDHLVATLALAEACALTPTPLLETAARGALDWTLRARNPYSGWRYSSPPVGDNDSFVTGWAVLALVAARDAGLAVDPAAFDGALSWLNDATDAANGRVGYTLMGSPSARVAGVNDHFPPEKGECLTALALASRLGIGQDPAQAPIMSRHADLLLKTLPEWDRKGFGVDPLYWWHGTEALAAYGSRHWKAWSTAARKALLASQRKDAHTRGSWDPIGPWGDYGGRVLSTALAALTLERLARR